MKLKTKLLFPVILLACVSVQAQVTIGSGIEPHKDALLDMKEEEDKNSKVRSSEKGLLLPRVSLKATDDAAPMTESNLILLEGMTVYNPATNGSGKTAVTPGVYYHNSKEWVKMGQQAKTGEWFYMPTVELDASSTGSKPDVDLYDLYKKQFSKSTNLTFVKNGAAPDDIPTLEKDKLHYYITYYDNTIFESNSMSISDGGVLSYSVKNEAVVPTYVTVVFVAK
jgi:hypothetical protein